MPTPNGAAGGRGLRASWASPPRSGARRLIAPWEYRHLRAWVRVRVASGTVLAGLGAVVWALSGADPQAWAWTAAFLAMAAAQFAFAYWELTIVRSLSPDAELDRAESGGSIDRAGGSG